MDSVLGAPLVFIGLLIIVVFLPEGCGTVSKLFKIDVDIAGWPPVTKIVVLGSGVLLFALGLAQVVSPIVKAVLPPTPTVVPTTTQVPTGTVTITLTSTNTSTPDVPVPATISETVASSATARA